MNEHKETNRIHDSRAEWALVAFAVVMPLVSLLSISV